MTIVIALQGLAATLAGLLFLEAWLRRGELDDGREFGASHAAAEIDFHPELIVAWDDEADYARKRPCTRSTGVDRPLTRRLQPVNSGQHQHRR